MNTPAPVAVVAAPAPAATSSRFLTAPVIAGVVIVAALAYRIVTAREEEKEREAEIERLDRELGEVQGRSNDALPWAAP